MAAVRLLCVERLPRSRLAHLDETQLQRGRFMAVRGGFRSFDRHAAGLDGDCRHPALVAGPSRRNLDRRAEHRPGAGAANNVPFPTSTRSWLARTTRSMLSGRRENNG